jgi:hypothetical protein
MEVLVVEICGEVVELDAAPAGATVVGVAALAEVCVSPRVGVPTGGTVDSEEEVTTTLVEDAGAKEDGATVELGVEEVDEDDGVSVVDVVLEVLDGTMVVVVVVVVVVEDVVVVDVVVVVVDVDEVVVVGALPPASNAPISGFATRAKPL